jgi:hypothetical protein
MALDRECGLVGERLYGAPETMKANGRAVKALPYQLPVCRGNSRIAPVPGKTGGSVTRPYKNSVYAGGGD